MRRPVLLTPLSLTDIRQASKRLLERVRILKKPHALKHGQKQQDVNKQRDHR